MDKMEVFLLGKTEYGVQSFGNDGRKHGEGMLQWQSEREHGRGESEENKKKKKKIVCLIYVLDRLLRGVTG